MDKWFGSKKNTYGAAYPFFFLHDINFPIHALTHHNWTNFIKKIYWTFCWKVLEQILMMNVKKTKIISTSHRSLHYIYKNVVVISFWQNPIENILLLKLISRYNHAKLILLQGQCMIFKTLWFYFGVLQV